MSAARADDLAAKAARMRASRQAPAAPEPTPTPEAPATPRRAAVRTKPVRLSTDVPQVLHTGLLNMCAEIAPQIGVARLAGQDVVRALLRIAMEDQSLRDRVRDEIATRTA